MEKYRGNTSTKMENSRQFLDGRRLVVKQMPAGIGVYLMRKVINHQVL